jgi:hypothetical protein
LLAHFPALAGGRPPFPAFGDFSYQLSKSYRDYSAMLVAAGRSREASNVYRRADATGY